MFKYFLIFCVLLHICLSQDIKNQTDVNDNEINPEDNKLNDKTLPKDGPQVQNQPKDELEYRQNGDKPNDDKPLPESVGGEEPPKENTLCDSKAREVYEKCKSQYKQITKDEQSSRRICCAVKTLQQCVLPVLNQYCSFEAINEMEKEFHGINHICRIVGSRYCPKVENLRVRNNSYKIMFKTNQYFLSQNID